MRVVTIQDKQVLEDLLRSGIYIVDIYKSKYKQYEESYRTMKELMDKHLGIRTLPIWGFNKVQGMVPPIDLDWEYYKGKGVDITPNSVIMELEVDERNMLIMDYYQWTDYMYFLGEGDTERANVSLQNLFDIDNADTIQICMPFMHKYMIKSYK